MATRRVVFEVDGAQSTSGVDFPIFALDGTTATIPYYQFSSTVTQGVQFTIPQVQEYGANPSAVILWNSDVNSGSAVWGCQLAAYDPNSGTDGLSSLAFDTITSGVFEHSGGNASRAMTATLSIDVAETDGLTNGDYLVISIQRINAHASDTLTGFAQLLGLSFESSDT